MGRSQPLSLLKKLFFAIILVAISPLIILILGFYLLVGFVVYLVVWCSWCTRGRDVLLVYSNSPIWQSYVEERLLPRLAHRAVVLNWSDRRLWRLTFQAVVLRFFGGSRDYNPMVVVFRPFRLARTFRYYKPFRDYKHGKPEAVDKLTDQLFALLEDRRADVA